MLLVLPLSLSVLCYAPSLGGAGRTPAVASRAAVSLITLPWRAKGKKDSDPDVNTVLQSVSRDGVLWPGAA